MIIGITGALLSFEQNILSYVNKNTYSVLDSNEKKIAIKDLLKDFKKEKTNVKITAVKFSNISSSSLVINVVKKNEDKKGFTYYVNPYTSALLKEEKGLSFFRTVENIHRKLLLKDFGKQIIGLSVIMLIILLISGVYLSFKKLKKRLFKSLTFKFKSNLRPFLSNIHSILGMWLVPFYLLAALSGLNWSYSWYNKAFYQMMNVDKPIRAKTKVLKNIKIENVTSIDDLSKAIKIFNSIVKNKYAYSLVKVPKEGTVYSFLYMDAKAKHRRERNKLSLDIKTKEILKHERFEDKNLNEQIMISMLTIHTGEYFGIIGQILMFILGLLLPFFGISGFILYIKKRKKYLS